MKDKIIEILVKWWRAGMLGTNHHAHIAEEILNLVLDYEGAVDCKDPDCPDWTHFDSEPE